MTPGFNFFRTIMPFQFCLLFILGPINKISSQNNSDEASYTAVIHGSELDTIFTRFNYFPHFLGIQFNDVSKLLFSFYHNVDAMNPPRMIAILFTNDSLSSVDCICSHFWERETFVPDPEPPYSIFKRKQYLFEFDLDSCIEMYHEPFITN